MIVTTSGSGFNIFKPTLDQEESDDDDESDDGKNCP